jgi:hypothetical protein
MQGTMNGNMDHADALEVAVPTEVTGSNGKFLDGFQIKANQKKALPQPPRLPKASQHLLPQKAPASVSAAVPETKVKHDYHDHSDDPDGEYIGLHQVVHKAGGACVEQSFPVKLHFMLKEIEKDRLCHIVSWQPHGRAFVVHNHRLFVTEVLGK